MPEIPIPNAETATAEELTHFIVEWQDSNRIRAEELIGYREGRARQVLDTLVNYLVSMRGLRHRIGGGTAKWPQRFAWSSYRYLPPPSSSGHVGRPLRGFGVVLTPTQTERRRLMPATKYEQTIIDTFKKLCEKNGGAAPFEVAQTMGEDGTLAELDSTLDIRDLMTDLRKRGLL
jgi:hypothetical protein